MSLNYHRRRTTGVLGDVVGAVRGVLRRDRGEELRPKLWTIHKTGQGEVYYHNTKLRRSTWTKPPELELKEIYLDETTANSYLKEMDEDKPEYDFDLKSVREGVTLSFQDISFSTPGSKGKTSLHIAKHYHIFVFNIVLKESIAQCVCMYEMCEHRLWSAFICITKYPFFFNFCFFIKRWFYSNSYLILMYILYLPRHLVLCVRHVSPGDDGSHHGSVWLRQDYFVRHSRRKETKLSSLFLSFSLSFSSSRCFIRVYV